MSARANNVSLKISLVRVCFSDQQHCHFIDVINLLYFASCFAESISSNFSDEKNRGNQPVNKWVSHVFLMHSILLPVSVFICLFYT